MESSASGEGHPPVRIAVSDPLPVFQGSVVASLQGAGFCAEAPEDLLAWLRDEERRVVVMTLKSAGDWASLAELRRVRPATLIVAMLEDSSLRGQKRAFSLGAVGVVPRNASATLIREVVEAAVRGTSLVPIEVLRALIVPRRTVEDADEGPSPRELAWLRELAGGATVGQLAERVGYSERAMFRLLGKLYVKMKVRNRTQALMRARELGWL